MATRPFFETLREIRRGQILDDCADELAKAVRAVDETGKPAKLTIELSIKPAAKIPGTYVISDKVRAELLNAKALIDKLQTLLDSKMHQVEGLHREVENLGATLKSMTNSACHWQDHAEAAERDRAAAAGALIMHADAEFLMTDPSTEALARHIVDKLVCAPEPDIDTVPLADLLEAVGTYLEHDQAVTIRGSHEVVRQVELHAMGLTFIVETHEASEALTKAQELGACLVQECAR